MEKSSAAALIKKLYSAASALNHQHAPHYHDSIVLILNEPTSALDIVTENSIMEAVRGLHGLDNFLVGFC